MNALLRGIKRCAALLLAAALVLCAVPAVHAAEPTPNFCDMFILVRFADAAGDTFNLSYDNGYGKTKNNFAELKKMVSTGGETYDYSTKAFIRAISEDRVVLNPYFPQESGGTVSVLTLSGAAAAYTGQDAGYRIVGEVIAKLRSGEIVLDPGVKLDWRESGLLDNLTLIVQGDGGGSLSESPIYPHSTTYEGTEAINAAGCRVFHYNVIDSASLFPTTAGEAPTLYQQQGVITHELMHTLGFADEYRYTGTGDPVGAWDIMAQASQWQAFPLAYERQQRGYITPMAVQTTAGSYRLDPVSKAGGACGMILKSPLSETEFFVVEYRVKGDSLSYAFDSKIPQSGLLIYRVDTRYDTNKAGDNFLYVFRQNPTSIGDAAEDIYGLQYAVLAPDAAGGLTSYGSTDLSKPYSDSTIYYSSGANSGIQISNVHMDGGQLAFDVSMADYASAGVWGAAAQGLPGGSCSEPSFAQSGATLYAAATVLTESSNTVVYASTAGAAWTKLGGDIAGLSQGRLFCTAGGRLLIAGCSAAGYETLYAWDAAAGVWRQQWSDTAAACSGAASFASDGTNVIVGYTRADGVAVCRDALTGQAALAQLAGALLSLPKLCTFQGKWYLCAADASGAAGSRKPQVYVLENGVWNAIYAFGADGANRYDICACGGKLYAATAGTQPAMVCFDGTGWAAVDIGALGSAGDIKLLASAEEFPRVAVLNNTTKTVSVWQGGGTWTKLGTDAGTGVDSMDAAAAESEIYAASMTENAGTWQVTMHALPAAPAAGESYVLAVTPPAGYTDTMLYVDGAAYAAAAAGGALRVTLPDGGAKTAVLYRYSAGGVPVGMGVWLLSYANGAYTAAWQPELENLLSYHGFSVRVTGKSGIRFKTGIDQTTKRQLAAGSLAGWRLKEYGTMVMRNSRRAELPFVLNGTGVKSGRAYWLENGAVHDQVFESAAGRDRFTSVLIGLPASEYKTEFAFRGYIVLEKNGVSYTLYGPIVARSIYTVAGQLLDRGEFAAGSAADAFLRKLRSDADAIG